MDPCGEVIAALAYRSNFYIKLLADHIGQEARLSLTPDALFPYYIELDNGPVYLCELVSGCINSYVGLRNIPDDERAAVLVRSKQGLPERDNILYIELDELAW